MQTRRCSYGRGQIIAIFCITAAVLLLAGCGGGGDAGDDFDPLAKGTWTARAPLPTPRQEMPVALLSGRIYVPGGMDPQGNALTVVEVYDPASDTWAAAPPLPEGRHHAGVAAAGGRLYVIGGYRPGPFPALPANTVFEFDPARGSWAQKAALPAPRAAQAAVEFGGRIYCIGGVSDAHQTPVGTNEVYDPATDSWESLPPLPTPREHLAAAVLDSRIIVVGGRVGAENRREAEAFSPDTGTWTALPPLPTARSGLAAAEMGGRLYVFGGEIPGVFAENERYNPGDGSWQAMTALPTPRHGMGAVTHGDRIFVLGGGAVAGLQPSAVNEAFALP